MDDFCWSDSNRLTYDLLFKVGLTAVCHMQEEKRRTWEGEGVKTCNRTENKNCNKINSHCFPIKVFLDGKGARSMWL